MKEPGKWEWLRRGGLTVTAVLALASRVHRVRLAAAAGAVQGGVGSHREIGFGVEGQTRASGAARRGWSAVEDAV